MGVLLKSTPSTLAPHVFFLIPGDRIALPALTIHEDVSSGTIRKLHV